MTRPTIAGGRLAAPALVEPFTFGSLFAGIGGLDLGLERAGMTCKFQVEIDPYAQRVLAKHWPNVRRHDDVRTFPPGDVAEWGVDLICGGFPCQDISFAGKGAGLEGERSGLWFEYARIIREIRPRYVLVENVSALLVRGLDAVLGTLATLGFDTEWGCIPAAAVGASHVRDRVFLVAHSNGERFKGMAGRPEPTSPQSERRDIESSSMRRQPGGQGHATLADADRPGLEVGACFGGNARTELAAFKRSCCEGSGVWATEPDVGRVADGVPARVERLRGLGNAVVPQVAEWLGRRIMEAAR